MKRILVIDDEAFIRTFLKDMMEEVGYQVIEARDGEVGLQLFQEKPADLVITDLVMPVKDGLKTILELREIDENVPVVAISGGGVIAKERYLSVAGSLDNVIALPKPFTKKEILGIVRELLS